MAQQTSNQTLQDIYTRSSVREYTDKPVSAELQEQLLRAAMSAPSAMNRQPWEFVVVEDAGIRKQLAQASPYSHAAKAPLVLVVCGDMKQALEGDGRDFWVQDCSAATENILIAANSLGLGAVWCGVYPDKERVVDIRKVLGMPESVIPLNIVCIGYPAAKPTPKDKWKPAKIHRNRY